MTTNESTDPSKSSLIVKQPEYNETWKDKYRFLVLATIALAELGVYSY